MLGDAESVIRELTVSLINLSSVELELSTGAVLGAGLGLDNGVVGVAGAVARLAGGSGLGAGASEVAPATKSSIWLSIVADSSEVVTASFADD